MIRPLDHDHRQLKLIAAKRNRSMGGVVGDLVDQELQELDNLWTGPAGLSLQQRALAEGWSDPALDIYGNA